MSAGAANSLSVVIIEGDPSVSTMIKNLLGEHGPYVIREADHAGGLRAVREHRPDLVFMELTATSGPALDSVQRIRNEFPQTSIIVSSAEATPDLILRSMRAGAQEFLGRPLNSKDVLEAVGRLTGLLRLTPRAEPRGGRVVAVFCTKGGVGVSSIATNLAVVLSRQNLRVSLVDLDFQSGDLELMLDLKTTMTISDVVGVGPIQEARVRSCLSKHESGICLLGAPHQLEDMEKISHADLVEIFGVLSAMFDYVVVDAGHTLDDRMLEVLELADMIVVPMLLNVPTVRSVSRALELFQKLGFPPGKALLVVNRDQKRTKIRVSDAEQTLGRNAFCTLPNDYVNMMRSIDVGVPVVVESGRSSIARSFEVLGNRVISLGEESSVAGTQGLFPRIRPLVAGR